MSKTALVSGNNWISSALVFRLLKEKKADKVIWLKPVKPHMPAPLPSLDKNLGGSNWVELFREAGLFEDSFEEPEEGLGLREFKNRSFQVPAWVSSPNPKDRMEILKDYLWGPESNMAPAIELTFPKPWSDYIGELREILGKDDRIDIKEGMEIISCEKTEEKIQVRLSSDDQVTVDDFYYCGDVSQFGKIDGVEKTFEVGGKRIRWSDVNRKWKPFGAVQVEFIHSIALNQFTATSFFAPITRDSGETSHRHLWGSFFENGKRSRWTVYLTAEEQEDNHAIARKIRKIKQTLNKMFNGSDWLPSNCKEFTDTVERETVRLEENFLYTESPRLTRAISVLDTGYLLTDQFGPESISVQLATVFGQREIKNSSPDIAELKDIAESTV